jgi:branched-chain amino acid transport system ATP-binding protein
MTALLTVDDLQVAYDQSPVLERVSLTISLGSITCLLGSNGSGKSTLIRTIVGLKSAAGGTVQYQGRDITNLPTHQIVAAGIACIPEGRRIFPKLSVEENLRMGAYQERDRAQITRRLEEVFEIFPRLRERRDQRAGTMSGGEQAMVSIGRGLVGQPKLLIIDEPSLGLSPGLVRETFRIIRDINRRGVTIFLVEQNVHQTLDISHFGYVLSKGRVRASGTPAELKNEPEVRSAYLGSRA